MSDRIPPPPLPGEAVVPSLAEVPSASRAALGAIVILGFAFDLTFNGQRPGVAVPLLALGLAFVLRAIAPRSIATDSLLGLAVIVSVFPALRASPPLAAFDVLAAAALLAFAATQNEGSVVSITVPGVIRRGFAIVSSALETPRFLARPLSATTRRRRVRSALRFLAITIPVLAVFGGLLASGDRVFGNLLTSILPSWDVSSIVGHCIVTTVGALLIAVLWRCALRREPASGTRDDAAPARGPRLTFPEWFTVLTSLDVMFATFVVVQLEYLFGGGHRIDVTPGLTYARYARSGFAQLAVAGALTVLVIIGAWDAGRRDHAGHERTFRALVTTMVTLTGVVLASAVMRLALYEGAFGFTVRRFFGYAAIVSIGGVLLVVLVAIWTRRRERLIAGLILVAVTATITVNVLDPERFVANRNIARFQAVGKIDPYYLGYILGADATPAVVGVLSTLRPADAAIVRKGLCHVAAELRSEPSWRSANAARAAARRALERAGITSATCASYR